jgi:preprotein translocase subunit SecA
VTVTHQPPQDPSGVNASLAQGAAALAAGNDSGTPAAAVATAAAVAAPAPGSAILRGGPAAAAVRGVTESLGDQPVTPVAGGNGSGASGGARPGYTPTGARIGRNDPCWCGSGAKYKKCHGA